jgi:tetrahydromethanopterin S-methyltransferase subunit F
MNFVLGGRVLARDGRAAGGTAAAAPAVFAAGVTVSVLLLSAIPNQS